MTSFSAILDKTNTHMHIDSDQRQRLTRVSKLEMLVKYRNLRIAKCVAWKA